MTKDLESQEHNLKTAKIHLPFKEETKYVKYIYIYFISTLCKKMNTTQKD